MPETVSRFHRVAVRGMRGAADCTIITMNPPSEDMILLTGTTASGKTDLSLEWARALDAEIVSCDSMLFYRGMDIGTAKPTSGERQLVPHHLIDVVPVSEPYNVKRYLEDAWKVVQGIMERGKKPLVVGGSGFYLSSFFEPVADEVPVDPEIRRRLEARLSVDGLESLVDELISLNRNRSLPVDLRNPRRVLRALERCLVTGKTVDELAHAMSRQPNPWGGLTMRLYRIERDPDDLHERVVLRTRAMLEGGLLNEVARLLEEGLERNPAAANAIGYRECIAVLKGERCVDGLEAEIIKNTRRLIRKQRSWFRNRLPGHEVIRCPAEGPPG